VIIGLATIVILIGALIWIFYRGFKNGDMTPNEFPPDIPKPAPAPIYTDSNPIGITENSEPVAKGDRVVRVNIEFGPMN
jgi:hypothetical protein